MADVGKLSKSFIEGAKKLGFSIEDLKSFYYIGGSVKEIRRRYFERVVVDKNLPFTFYSAINYGDSHCICKVYIEDICFITNDKVLIQIGNCCMEKFLEIKGKTCSICKVGHKNRKDNFCNDCREKGYKLCAEHNIPMLKNCEKCEEDIRMKEAARRLRRASLPKNPKESTLEKKCADCGNPSKNFYRCYPCKMKKEGKVNNCKNCGKECGTYWWCFKCFTNAKKIA